MERRAGWTGGPTSEHEERALIERSSILAALLFAVPALSACAGTGAPSGGSSGGELIVDFEGPLQAAQAYPTVSGSVRAVASLGTTAVFVNLRGGQRGASHPWRIHTGRCGSNGASVAPSDAFPPLEPGDDGSDRVTTTIPVQLSPSGSYHVNVHLSRERMDVIIGCGELTD
jgi:hypothetical protein